MLAVAIWLGRNRLEVGPGGFEFVVGHLADSRPWHEEMNLLAIGMGTAVLKWVHKLGFGCIMMTYRDTPAQEHSAMAHT